MESMGMLSGGSARQEGKKLWQYLAAVSVCFLSIGVGTGLAWSSPVLDYLRSPQSHIPIDKEEESWISSLCAIGAMIGALPAGSIANATGRKRLLLMLAAPFLLSWVLIIFANQVWILYVARVIVGIAIGAVCVLVPTYLSEIAEISVKGTLGALFQFFLTVGIVFTFTVGAVGNYYTVAASCAVFEVIFFVTFIFMPESPIWLMNQGRKSEASKALKKLRGDDYDIHSELSTLQKEAEDNDKKRSSVFDLVRLPVPRKALFICFAGMIFQQLSGINAVIFYTADIFKAAKSTLEPKIAAIPVALVQCVMALVAAAIVDKAGRKPLLIFSSSVMSLSLIALGLFYKLQESSFDTSNIGWLPMLSLILFMIAFSLGMGPIPWMLTGEMFEVELQGGASSLAVVLNWFLVFLVTKTFPTMKEIFQASGAFWIFAGVMVIAAVFTYVVVPETKGKSIQEVQEELGGTKGSNKRSIKS